MSNPREAKLRLHPSPGLRLSCLMLNDNPIAMAGAALGLCWVGPGRPKVKITPADMGTYGVQVYDDVVRRDGVTAKDFWDAANAAVKLLANADDPGDDEVAEHMGNSGPAPSAG